jgi:ribosomal protein S18 acetylase RimI-like enzyme
MACVPNAISFLPGTPSRAFPFKVHIEPLKRRDDEFEDLLDELSSDMIDVFPGGRALGRVHTYVARNSAGHYLGTGSIEIRVSKSGNLFGHVTDVVVKEEYRGLGIGSFVVQQLIKVAKQCCCQTVDLVCEGHNVSFYVHNGFSPSTGNRMIMKL